MADDENSKKILIVDDEQDFLDVLCSVFTKNNWQVIRCSNAEIAISYLEKDKFDCILTDLNMPNVNGFDLICAVRASQSNRTTAIFAMSGYYTENQLKQKLGFSITSFIDKPFRYNLFEKAYEKYRVNASNREISNDFEDMSLMDDD